MVFVPMMLPVKSLMHEAQSSGVEVLGIAALLTDSSPY